MIRTVEDLQALSYESLVEIAPSVGVNPGRMRKEALLPRIAEAMGLDGEPPDEWTRARRTAANLRAMRLMASLPAEGLSDEVRAALGQYSGWGGLSIDAVEDELAGLTKPEKRGLINEYYTPTVVAREIARMTGLMLTELPRHEGRIHALEPSAGIGRLMRAFDRVPGGEQIAWHAVEWSKVSHGILSRLRPEDDVFQGPFEKWVSQHGHQWHGKLGLVVSNPPYGERGPSKTEDPDRRYRENQAFAYFMRRALDLLAPGGLGIFIVPAGFVTGTGTASVRLRELVLLRHHLAAAFRLPSRLFPGAMLALDLIFFRARGGELDAVHPSDQHILEGQYFIREPQRILGEEVVSGGKARLDEARGEQAFDARKKSRFGYQVVGEFTSLPPLRMRAVCSDCIPARAIPAPKAPRTVKINTASAEGRAMALAARLGLRVRHYTRVLADGDQDPRPLHSPLLEALDNWRSVYGNPQKNKKLRQAARAEFEGAASFLSAFDKDGQIVSSLSAQPHWRPRLQGKAGDLQALAKHLLKTQRRVLVDELHALHRSLGGTSSPATLVGTLAGKGWNKAGEALEELVPDEVYFTGWLWPKVEHAERFGRDPQMVRQAQALRSRIASTSISDIDFSPRDPWLPLELVAEWMRTMFAVTHDLRRHEGFVIPANAGDFSNYYEHRKMFDDDFNRCLGWINHDLKLFRPYVPKDSDPDELGKKRLELSERWTAQFRAWILASDERTEAVEEAYTRTVGGFVELEYSEEPLPIARYSGSLKPHGFQNQAVRMLLANGGGMVAFDVGLGKTLTGSLALGRAKQEGRARRAVVAVPRSLVPNWERALAEFFPDFSVIVIGIKRKRDGTLGSSTEAPADRAAKWTEFKAGAFDVALVTFEALSRVRVSLRQLEAYAKDVAAIQRQIEMARRNRRNKASVSTEKEEAALQRALSERQEAISDEKVGGWVAERMELPPGQVWDPDIRWEELGIDFLMVDEGQAFKNLYMPESGAFGQTPMFMGSGSAGSKRAWGLDFRAHVVRQHTGGTGVYILSATPAKNSPLEIYNVVQYLGHHIWKSIGIRTPAEWSQRFLKIEPRLVSNADGSAITKEACVGIKNAHELRDVLARFTIFKTAGQAGIKLPEPDIHLEWVEMDGSQRKKYDVYAKRVSNALGDPDMAGQILGLLNRMNYTAIHPRLDEGWDWKTVQDANVNPHAPKLDLCADRILDKPDCGHIVFADNVAAHVWMKEVLVERGMDAGRIAILNAKSASPSGRQKQAERFNKGELDVVIANKVAYEGINLQVRTCAIHHLDLPWDPGTLQQRNGRGVRQGNRLAMIAIHYYVARRSTDGYRFQLIDGKAGWLAMLAEGEGRETNNPAAQVDLSPADIAVMIAPDPEAMREAIAARRAIFEAERKAKAAKRAATDLRVASLTFRRAAAHQNADRAASLEGQAEALLARVRKTSVEDWPFSTMVDVARDHVVYTLEAAPHIPLWDGLRLAVTNAAGEQAGYEIGQLDFIGKRVAARRMGDLFYMPQHEAQIIGWGDFSASLYNWAGWQEDKDAKVLQEAGERFERIMSGGWERAARQFQLANDAWATRMWAAAGQTIRDKVVSRYRNRLGSGQAVPTVEGGALKLLDEKGEITRAAVSDILPPTLVGHRAFIALAGEAGMGWTEADQIARWWWGVGVPRGSLGQSGKADASKANARRRLLQAARRQMLLYNARQALAGRNMSALVARIDGLLEVR